MNYREKALREFVEDLITQHREAEFWNMRQEWHKRTQDLIKDIICFTNTMPKYDNTILLLHNFKSTFPHLQR